MHGLAAPWGPHSTRAPQPVFCGSAHRAVPGSPATGDSPAWPHVSVQFLPTTGSTATAAGSGAGSSAGQGAAVLRRLCSAAGRRARPKQPTSHTERSQAFLDAVAAARERQAWGGGGGQRTLGTALQMQAQQPHVRPGSAWQRTAGRLRRPGSPHSVTASAGGVAVRVAKTNVAAPLVTNAGQLPSALTALRIG